ncbi:hypothetical protein V6N13_117699 [Hibiscus sabdariffa]|uniref:Uncharacterized protein n=2 Tax=Hibiscus sabdariffa TaxID=183260 RepID=A0ABR2AI68_9ROSI
MFATQTAVSTGSGYWNFQERRNTMQSFHRWRPKDLPSACDSGMSIAVEAFEEMKKKQQALIRTRTLQVFTENDGEHYPAFNIQLIFKMLIFNMPNSSSRS